MAWKQGTGEGFGKTEPEWQGRAASGLARKIRARELGRVGPGRRS